MDWRVGSLDGGKVWHGKTEAGITVYTFSNGA